MQLAGAFHDRPELLQRRLVATGVLGTDREVVAAAVDRVLVAELLPHRQRLRMKALAGDMVAIVGVGDEGAQRQQAGLQLGLGAGADQRRGLVEQRLDQIGTPVAPPADAGQGMQGAGALRRIEAVELQPELGAAQGRIDCPALNSSGPSTVRPRACSTGSGHCSIAAWACSRPSAGHSTSSTQRRSASSSRSHRSGARCSTALAIAAIRFGISARSASSGGVRGSARAHARAQVRRRARQCAALASSWRDAAYSRIGW